MSLGRLGSMFAPLVVETLGGPEHVLFANCVLSMVAIFLCLCLLPHHNCDPVTGGPQRRLSGVFAGFRNSTVSMPRPSVKSLRDTGLNVYGTFENHVASSSG